MTRLQRSRLRRLADLEQAMRDCPSDESAEWWRLFEELVEVRGKAWYGR